MIIDFLQLSFAKSKLLGHNWIKGDLMVAFCKVCLKARENKEADLCPAISNQHDNS